MDNKALLEAVNKAIEALEEVRRELLNTELVENEEPVPALKIDAEPGAEVTIWPLGTGPEMIPEPAAAEPEPKPTILVCPGCGIPYTPGEKFCMHCGTSLAAKAEPEPDPMPRANTCPSCGMLNDSGSKFCMICGTPLSGNVSRPAQSAVRSAFCIKCGAPLEPGDKFCMKCGTKV